MPQGSSAVRPTNGLLPNYHMKVIQYISVLLFIYLFTFNVLGAEMKKQNMNQVNFNVSPCIFDSLDFIYTNQCTFYTQMYQSFKYTLKSLKTL